MIERKVGCEVERRLPHRRWMVAASRPDRFTIRPESSHHALRVRGKQTGRSWPLSSSCRHPARPVPARRTFRMADGASSGSLLRGWTTGHLLSIDIVRPQCRARISTIRIDAGQVRDEASNTIDLTASRSGFALKAAQGAGSHGKQRPATTTLNPSRDEEIPEPRRPAIALWKRSPARRCTTAVGISSAESQDRWQPRRQSRLRRRSSPARHSSPALAAEAR